MMFECESPADTRLLFSGPGRLTQALAINGSHNGLPVDGRRIELIPSFVTAEVLVGVRVGISKAQDMPWRFGLAGSRFVSRRFA